MAALYTFYHKGANKTKRDDNSLPKIVGMNTTSTFGVSSSILEESYLNSISGYQNNQ